ncbi:glycosyltransferase N-terminal domain-containing protein [Nemorincola caseinilytica]|uniref:3-deoxy-D-manno-octulosonic acid transferase n=2 Tax=Nemorincola caseinilytica TaxID=2054315 RepID=A0ABP8N617_9BACT
MAAVFLYRLSLALYGLGIRVAALYSDKARKWVAGRRNWQQELQKALAPGKKRIWIHCSSLGEFEQGRPLIELLSQRYPAYEVVLTFFSPSGYEACRGYTGVHHILYLPMDGPAAARHFVAAVDPELVIFVKYEFWHYYLHEVNRRGIPLLLVSAAFRQQQSFFKGYGGFFRGMLRCFSHIHVQDAASAALLAGIGIKDNVSISGDTRYDRVTAIAQRLRPIAEAERFRGDSKVLVAGSTWPDDEKLIKDALPALPTGWKLIIAPHEIDAAHIRQVQELFAGECALYSALAADASLYQKRILIIDNIGMLSSLYAYGHLAYVGGGFARGGIHNTLEPAIFGLPVVMGPVYEKFVEAVRLVEIGGAFPVADATAARAIFHQLATDDTRRLQIHDTVSRFMKENTGAADRICAQVAASGWLSS